uniref:Uncharacterized protein n=1 Tax=Emiliania huxleyi TaxID=2903 RepID=A0A7S3RLN5_EMIHU
MSPSLAPRPFAHLLTRSSAHRSSAHSLTRSVQVGRLASRFGARRMHIAISERASEALRWKGCTVPAARSCEQERIFSSRCERDAAYNAILAFIGAPRVGKFHEVFTRPGKYDQAERVSLTDEAAQLLRGVYTNDTQRLFARLGYTVPEWEAWYCERGVAATPCTSSSLVGIPPQILPKFPLLPELSLPGVRNYSWPDCEPES